MTKIFAKQSFEIGFFYALFILPFLWGGCTPYEPESVQVQDEGMLTATVSSYNKAVLSGDKAGIKTQFDNTSRSGNRIGEGHVATLTISGLPKGWISDVMLWAHSNTQSGGGDINVIIDGDVVASMDGSFADWAGCYSTSSLAIPLFRKPHECLAGSITLTITGWENSLYLDKLELHYSSTYPSPKSLILSYWTNGNRREERECTEDGWGEGITLPQVSDIRDKDGNMWYFTGWTRHKVEDVTASPIFYFPHQVYFPTMQDSLYALYRNQSASSIHQTTTFSSGEYAMVCPMGEDWGIIAGGWKKNLLSTAVATVEYEIHNGYTLLADTIATAARYWMEFDSDSVLIRNMGTDEWLGYGSNGTNKQKIKWAWMEGENHSLYIYHDLEHVTNTKAQLDYWCAYSWGITVVDDSYLSVGYMKYQWEPTQTYWLLFPSAQFPTRMTCLWSTEMK